MDYDLFDFNRDDVYTFHEIFKQIAVQFFNSLFGAGAWLGAYNLMYRHFSALKPINSAYKILNVAYSIPIGFVFGWNNCDGIVIVKLEEKCRYVLIPKLI